MSNKLIEHLFNKSVDEDERGIKSFNHNKVKQTVTDWEGTMVRNKDIFRKEEPNFYSCKMYKPCNLCDKCQNRASHLYVQCQNCKIPKCVHTQGNKSLMLKRKNFNIRVSTETIGVLKKVAEEVEINVNKR